MTEVKQEEDFLINSQGFKVLKSEMRPQDLLINEFILQRIFKAKVLSEQIEEFKKVTFTEIQDFLSLLWNEYNVEKGGKKGNLTLTSFDGKSQIVVSIDDQITFGPEIDIAKQLINEVIEAELTDTSGFVSQLFRDAFEADKQGQYNKARIFALRKYRDANDSETWQMAMKALDDAMILSDSKTYIAFKQRNEFGKWIQIPLASKSL